MILSIDIIGLIKCTCDNNYLITNPHGHCVRFLSQYTPQLHNADVTFVTDGHIICACSVAEYYHRLGV